MRLLAACLAMVACAAPADARAATVPASWDRGFVLTAFWHNEYTGFDAATSLRELRAAGANSVALIVTWYQPEIHSSVMTPDPFRTPSDESLVRIMRAAEANGLDVMLRLVVDVESGTSRTLIEPQLPGLWFDAYGRMVDHYSALARSGGIDSLQIGVELSGMTDGYEADWRSLVARARARFDGELTYGANWDEYPRIHWWDALDAVAIDAYFPLAADARPRSEDEIAGAWTETVDRWGARSRHLDEIRAVQARTGKPVLFSEIGYASIEGNLVEPWRTDGRYSGEAQVRATNAAIRVFAGEPWFRGMYFWQWRPVPGAGGPGDTDHTPQAKPAQRAIAGWFGGS
jgi:hypothetical protein